MREFNFLMIILATIWIQSSLAQFPESIARLSSENIDYKHDSDPVVYNISFDSTRELKVGDIIQFGFHLNSFHVTSGSLITLSAPIKISYGYDIPIDEVSYGEFPFDEDQDELNFKTVVAFEPTSPKVWVAIYAKRPIIAPEECRITPNWDANFWTNDPTAVHPPPTRAPALCKHLLLICVYTVVDVLNLAPTDRPSASGKLFFIVIHRTGLIML
jgi:hypothetical protein